MAAISVNKLTGFIRSRSEWAEVSVVQNERGDYGVALTLDGWYGSRRDAEEIAEFIREQIVPDATTEVEK